MDDAEASRIVKKHGLLQFTLASIVDEPLVNNRYYLNRRLRKHLACYKNFYQLQTVPSSKRLDGRKAGS